MPFWVAHCCCTLKVSSSLLPTSGASSRRRARARSSAGRRARAPPPPPPCRGRRWSAERAPADRSAPPVSICRREAAPRREAPPSARARRRRAPAVRLRCRPTPGTRWPAGSRSEPSPQGPEPESSRTASRAGYSVRGRPVVRGAAARGPAANTRTRPAGPPGEALVTSFSSKSTHALHVGGDVADLLGRQTPGDAEHHRAVAARLLGIGAAVACAARIIVQLLDHVHGLLRPQGGVSGGEIAASDRPMTGDATRDLARAIAPQVQRLTVVPVRGVGLEPGRRLRLVVDGEIVDVLVAQGCGERLHHRVGAHLRAEQPQLLGDVDRTLTGEARPLRVRSTSP